MDNDGVFLSCFLVAYDRVGEREDLCIESPFWVSEARKVVVFPSLDRDGLKTWLYNICYDEGADVFHVLMGFIGNHFVINAEMNDGWRNRLVIPMDQWHAGNKRHYDRLRVVVDEVNALLEAQYAADKIRWDERARLTEENEKLRRKLQRAELYRELKQEFEGE